MINDDYLAELRRFAARVPRDRSAWADDVRVLLEEVDFLTEQNAKLTTMHAERTVERDRWRAMATTAEATLSVRHGLRQEIAAALGIPPTCDDNNEALRIGLETIRALQLRVHGAEASVQRLTAALQPFANMASRYDPPDDDDDLRAWDVDPTIGHLRAARAAIAEGAN